MTRWIALLRGINVGGNNMLQMADLRALLTGLGYSDVKTYIQSGNCIFGAPDTADAISKAVSEAITACFGLRIPVLMRTTTQLTSALDANPYANEPDAAKTVHLFFLGNGTGVDMHGLHGVRKDNEHITLAGNILYLHAPEGVGRSKLALTVSKHISGTYTARNLNSVNKILALATST